MITLRHLWATSKLFRIFLIITSVYTCLRIAGQIYLMQQRMLPGQSETQLIPNDMQDYIDAATRLANHEYLYPVTTDYGKYYQYSPIFALAISPFLSVPPSINLSLNFILRLIGYAILFIWWGRIFQKAKWTRALEIWAWSLPLWLVFSAFWSDLTYMNIYILTALFCTLFIDAILEENLGLSILWLTILLQTKPFWAFALAVPLLLGRWKFFIKLLVGGLVTTAATGAVFLLVVGPSYGWQQLTGFIHFLATLNNNFPWRGPDAGLLGYNHSITQIVVFLFGISRASFNAAILIKTILLIPLIILGIKNILHPARRPGYEVTELALGLVFGLYLGVFIWVDMVWEASLGIAAFIYLLALLDNKKVSKVVIWVAFLPYALIDLWQIISYAVLGDSAFVANGEYLVTDYSYYIPIVMILILVFYGILIKRVWDIPTLKSSIT
jgi:hypothetical protein